MEKFKTKENMSALLELQYWRNHVKFPLIASFLEKVMGRNMMNIHVLMNVFFPLFTQTGDYIAVHNQ